MDIRERLKNEGLEEVEKSLLGLDDTFLFKCRHCGKCCHKQESIILTPRDIFRIARKQERMPASVIGNYCEVYLGPESLVPVVHLLPNGPGGNCPLLGPDKRCTVHDCKPTVCALYPLGRVMVGEKAGDSLTTGEPRVKYMLNDHNCGSRKRTFSVREWLAQFGIPEHDDFFFQWNDIICTLSNTIRGSVVNDRIPEEAEIFLLHDAFPLLYIHYNIYHEFEAQFEANASVLRDLCKGIEEAYKHGKDGQA